MGYFSGIIHPEFFQGNKKKRDYFEGWYFKHECGKTVFALIPGISLARDDRHAFVQLIVSDDVTKSYYLRYPLSQFYAAKDRLFIKIGKNIFSKAGIYVDLRDKGVDFFCRIRYGAFTPLQKSALRPGIMGYFSYFPGMECSHGVVSLRHRITGHVCYGGSDISIPRGLGYIEKDWGTSFPTSYLWMQCNNFPEKKASCFFSYAIIPFVKTHFRGLICTLLVGKRQYLFATYNLSRVGAMKITPSEIRIVLERGEYRLVIRAERTQAESLNAPLRGNMHRIIKESLRSNLTVTLIKKGHTLFHAVGINAGLEEDGVFRLKK